MRKAGTGKEKDGDLPKDFGVAARDVRADFTPTELQKPVPWPLIALSVALAVWGGVTLYVDARSTPVAEDAQIARSAAEAGTAAAPITPAALREARGDTAAAQGAWLFGNYCATCHQTNGSGVRGAIPPLDGSRYVEADAEVPAAILLRGISGPIEVGGDLYDGRMPTFHAILDDEEIALILTHVRGAWSNSAGPVAPERVAAVREALAGDLARPWADGFELERAFGVAASPPVPDRPEDRSGDRGGTTAASRSPEPDRATASGETEQ